MGARVSEFFSKDLYLKKKRDVIFFFFGGGGGGGGGWTGVVGGVARVNVLFFK